MRSASEARMTAEAARKYLPTIFPFPGLLDRVDALVEVASTAARHVPAGGSVLDFGCGPADKTAMLALMGFTCHGADDLADEWHDKGAARERILDFAASLGIDYHVLMEGDLDVGEGPYDMVMMHHVLEHLHDSPKDLLLQLLEKVKPGGHLFVTVPNHANIRKRFDLLRGRTTHNPYAMYYWYPSPWRGHVREYTRGDCEELTRFLGLELVELKGVHHMLQKVPRNLRTTYTRLSRLAPGARDTWSLVARKPVDWQPRRELAVADFRALTGLRGWSTEGQAAG